MPTTYLIGTRASTGRSNKSSKRRTRDAELLGCVGLVPTTTAVEHEPALARLRERIASLDAAHWHNGYAHELLLAVLTLAFGALELPMGAAVNGVPNVASERMLNALGFEMPSEVQAPKFRMRTYILPRTVWQDRSDA